MNWGYLRKQVRWPSSSLRYAIVAMTATGMVVMVAALSIAEIMVESINSNDT